APCRTLPGSAPGPRHRSRRAPLRRRARAESCRHRIRGARPPRAPPRRADRGREARARRSRAKGGRAEASWRPRAGLRQVGGRRLALAQGAGLAGLEVARERGVGDLLQQPAPQVLVVLPRLVPLLVGVRAEGFLLAHAPERGRVAAVGGLVGLALLERL